MQIYIHQKEADNYFEKKKTKQQQQKTKRWTARLRDFFDVLLIVLFFHA